MEFQTETASLEHGTSSRNETAYLVCKRAFDIAASFCALVVLSPVFLIIYLIIYLDDPHGNPIFSQIRIGKNGKAFRFYKFRSMVVNAEDLLAGLQNQNEMSGPAFKMKNDPRVTKVGRFIRKTSLDELPQLWNVLKGDMSLVGPRPPLPNEVEQYTEEQKKRLSITPGLTCYWQVQPSRNDLDFGEWFELDMKYLRERSMKTDIKIIFQTILVVLHMEGV